MKTFSSRKPIKFRKEISMCSRRNMSWTTALIAPYGRRADNESARQFRYPNQAHRQERKRVIEMKDCFHAGAVIALASLLLAPGGYAQEQMSAPPLIALFGPALTCA
jgi:hypothetical protein